MVNRFRRLMALMRRARAIYQRQPGYGSPDYRGHPYEAVVLIQQAERLAGRS